MHAYVNETPIRTSLHQTASFEPSCMFVRLSVRPLRDCEKKIQKKKKYQKKKVTKSLYFTYAWGRPYPTDCNGSWHIGLGQQRNQSCKFLWLYVKGFGFCEGSNIGFSHRKLTWSLQHCLAQPRWHVITFTGIVYQGLGGAKPPMGKM
jgi:hypothetical protein